MKKLIRIAGIAASVVLIFFITVLVLAKFLITTELVRSTVLPLAEKKLQRQVTLGDIEVNLFSGIVLKDLAVKEREGGENFVAADAVELHYRFWPLLFLKVVVNEVKLEKPEIRVERNSDGTFNFSDLLAPRERKEAPAPVAEPAEGPPINLLVSSLVVSGGKLLFLDQALGGQTPFSYQIEDLSLQASDIALERSFPYSAKASFQGAPLRIKGEIDLRGPEGTAEVGLDNFDVTAFQPYFQESLPGNLQSLMVNVDLQAEGGMEKVSSKGTIVLDKIDLILDAMQEAPVKGARASLEYDLTSDMKTAILQLDKAAVDVNGIKIESAGKITDYTSEPQVNLTVHLPKLEVNTVLAAVPASMVKDIASMKPAGSIRAEVNLSGPISEPGKMLQQGMLELAALQAGKGDLRPELNGKIDLKGDSLTSRDFSLRAGDNQADIDLTVANLFSRPIMIDSTITSDRFALDPLLKAMAAPGATGEKKEKGKEQEEKTEIGPFAIPVKANGRVLVATTLYKGLQVTDFDLAYHLDNNVLTVDHLTGKVADGNFSKNARIDLGKQGLDYQADVTISSVQADPLVSAFVPKAAGTVFGNLFLDLKARGQGVQVEDIKKSLSGQGEFQLLDGKITGAGMAEGLATFLDLEKLRVLQFSRLKGEYTIKDGRLRINTDLSGSDIKMHPTGTVGLDGSLDLTLDVRLSPEYANRLDEKGKVMQFLKDEQGWAQLPIKAIGTLDKPRFIFDSSGVKQQLQEKAGQTIQKKLQEEVLDKLAPKEGESQGGEEPARKMLRDTLQGILGK